MNEGELKSGTATASDSIAGGALPARPSLAYLVSTYPTLSMTFVLREVLALRTLGFRIETASINPPERTLENMTSAEAAEAQRTYCLKRHGIAGALGADFRTLMTNFPGYLRGMVLALRLGGFDLRRLFFNLMYLTEAFMVGQWMKRNGLRHLHVHLASQAATVGLFVREVFGFGYSMTVHGPDEFYDAAGKYLPEKAAAADFIICISSFARSQMMLQSPYTHWQKFEVIPLGIDPEVFTPRAQNPGPDPFEVLCVGRLTPAKGQHLLIDAVNELSRQGRSVRLRLVGGGPDDATLRQHAARIDYPERIVFSGAVNQDRIRDFYAAADAFCLPSFAEGVPVVLMEAMAMEIPCVTTRITGIPELIRDGIDGLLVAPSDVTGLVQALARLMEDTKLRARIGKAGRTRVETHYDLRQNVQRLATALAERARR
ncbi:MAG: glycosyltransferase family 4 protein [Acidobacteriota bacterium]